MVVFFSVQTTSMPFHRLEWKDPGQFEFKVPGQNTTGRKGRNRLVVVSLFSSDFWCLRVYYPPPPPPQRAGLMRYGSNFNGRQIVKQRGETNSSLPCTRRYPLLRVHIRTSTKKNNIKREMVMSCGRRPLTVTSCLNQVAPRHEGTCCLWMKDLS